MKKTDEIFAIVVDSCIFTLSNNLAGGAIPPISGGFFIGSGHENLLPLSTPVSCINVHEMPAKVFDNGPGSKAFFLIQFRMSNTKRTNPAGSAFDVQSAFISILKATAKQPKKDNSRPLRADGKPDLRYGNRADSKAKKSVERKAREASITARQQITPEDVQLIEVVKNFKQQATAAEVIKSLCFLLNCTMDYLTDQSNFGSVVNTDHLRDTVFQTTSIIELVAGVE